MKFESVNMLCFRSDFLDHISKAVLGRNRVKILPDSGPKLDFNSDLSSIPVNSDQKTYKISVIDVGF